MVNLNLKISTKTAVNWSQQQQFTHCSIISRTDLQKPRLELLPSPAVSLGRDQLLPHGDCLFWHRTSCSVGYLLSGNRCNWTECSQTNKFPLPVHMLRCTPQLSNPRPQSYNFTKILFNCISSTEMASFPPPSSVSVFINLAHQLILVARGYNLSISCACALRRAKQLPGRKLCQCLFERIVPSLPCHKTRNLS